MLASSGITLRQAQVDHFRVRSSFFYNEFGKTAAW